MRACAARSVAVRGGSRAPFVALPAGVLLRLERAPIADLGVMGLPRLPAPFFFLIAGGIVAKKPAGLG